MKIAKLLLPLILQLFFAIAANSKVYDFTFGNKLTLLPNARQSAVLKLDLIKNAKHHIHIMTYYLDKTDYPMELLQELRKANERGVQVRIMTSYIPTLALDFWDEATKVLLTNRSGTNKSVPMAYLKFNPEKRESITNNIHEKIFLVDGVKAILGGRNISKDSFRDKDLEIIVEGPVVNQVQSHFEKMFSFLIQLKLKENTTFKSIEDLKNLNFSLKDTSFFPLQKKHKQGVKARILSNEILLNQYGHNYEKLVEANISDDIIDTILKINFSKLRAYNYFIIPTKRYKDFLLKKVEEGKVINIITNSITTSAATSDLGYLYSLPEMYNLVAHGIKVHQWLGSKIESGKDQLLYLHEKVMLFDNDHGIIGSHNFGSGSTTVSSEIALEFFAPEIVSELNKVFDNELNTLGVTKEASLVMLQNELQENRNMIFLLHTKLFNNFVLELY